MKKRLAVVIGGLLTVGLLAGYYVYTQSIQRGQDTVVKIYQNDENGTPIVSPSPITLVRKAGHRNPFQAGISEYLLTSKDPLWTTIPRRNQTLRLTYRSTLTTTKLRERLRRAQYWQVGTQAVGTPAFNGTQYQGDQRTVGRISTSSDGLTWTKLPISYPNVALTDPLVWYHTGTLALIDGQTVYQTTDFHTWRQRRLKLTNRAFKQARPQALVEDSTGQSHLIVRAVDRRTNKERLYVSRWRPTANQPNQWSPLTVPAFSKSTPVNFTRIGNAYYLLQYQRRHVRIMRAATLTGTFKRVANVKVSVNKKDQLNSLNLIKIAKGRYRVVFNTIDRKHVQAGTFYQDLTSRFKLVGDQQKLEPDFVWCRFHLIDHPS